MRVELPGDAWAEIVDPEDVIEKRRKPVKRKLLEARAGTTVDVGGNAPGLSPAALTPELGPWGGGPEAAEPSPPAVQLTSEAMEIMDDAFDLATVAIVESWSFEQPVTVDGLLSIPGRAYNVLVKHGQDACQKMFPDYGPSPEADSPT